ncbi:MAG: hypothetical protein FGM24_09365 [Candidatus Kapabacteria bacterium]|nr:hypothetical protein [Candidatus Kapabacteria bacterium]
MMSADAIIRSAVDRMGTAFDLAEVDEALSAESLLAAVRAQLVDRIIYLLNTNPERLMAILYRIDVSESRVNEIFSTALPPDMPERLADLVIERQLAKAETRARFKEQG